MADIYTLGIDIGSTASKSIVLKYDYPVIKKHLEQKGIHTLLIEVDKQVRNYEQARTAIQSFQEMIRL